MAQPVQGQGQGQGQVPVQGQASGGMFSWLKMPSFLSSSSTQAKVVTTETIAKCDKDYNDAVTAAGKKRDDCKAGKSWWTLYGGKKRRGSKKANKKSNKKSKAKKSKSQKKR